MAFPYTEVFLGLLLVYMVYSVWAHLDARYAIAAALVLLVATAVVDALGSTASANTLAEFVFFLLGAGVVLLLIDHVREGRGLAAPSDRASSVPPSEPVPSHPPPAAERKTEEPAGDIEPATVPLVPAVRDEVRRDRPQRPAEPEDGDEEIWKEEWMDEESEERENHSHRKDGNT